MISLGLTDYTKMPDGPKGIVRGIMPSSNGDAPPMGTRDLLEGFDSMPWLRAVSDKVAMAVACLCWELYTVKRAGRAVQERRLQRATGSVRSKLMGKYEDEGSLTAVDDHLFLDALESPNPFMTRMSLLKITEIHLDLVGDSFWLKERNGLGAPVGFWPIPPHWVMETPTPSDPTYRVSYRGWQAIIPESEIHRFHENAPVHPYTRGSGIGWTLGDELEVDEYAAKMARQLFFNRAKPDFVVMGFENPEEKDRLEQDWVQRNQGFWRQNRPYFMTGEPKIHEFQQPTMEQLVYPNLRKAQRDIVLQVWGAPPELFGIVENSNRATIEAAEYLFTKWVVCPKGERLRGGLQKLAQEEYDERLVVHFESPVAEDKAHKLNVMKAAPWNWTRDEWRVEAGDAPATDGPGDERAIPMNYSLDAVPWADKTRTDMAGILIRAGFAAADAARVAGLPPMEHTGQLPVTVQPEDKPTAPLPPGGAPADPEAEPEDDPEEERV